MGLEKEVLRGILRMGYKVPTPVQRKALPVALAGLDIGDSYLSNLITIYMIFINSLHGTYWKWKDLRILAAACAET